MVNLPRPLTMSVETSRTLGPARTDAEGRFVLEAPRKLFDNYCMADLVAYRPGSAAGLHSSIPEEGKEATIRLDREEPLCIRLLDLEGRPASRARIRVAKLWKRKPTLCAIFMTSAPDRPLPGWLGMMIADDQGQLTITGLAPTPNSPWRSSTIASPSSGSGYARARRPRTGRLRPRSR